MALLAKLRLFIFTTTGSRAYVLLVKYVNAKPYAKFYKQKAKIQPKQNRCLSTDTTLLHRALLTSFLCKQTSVTTLTVIRYLHPASIFNPGNPYIQKNQSYRLLHSVVDSTFVSRDVNVRNFYLQSLPASSQEKKQTSQFRK